MFSKETVNRGITRNTKSTQVSYKSIHSALCFKVVQVTGNILRERAQSSSLSVLLVVLVNMYQRWFALSKSKVRAMRALSCFIALLCIISRFNTSKHSRNRVLVSERSVRQESLSFQFMKPTLQRETGAVNGPISRFCKTTPYRHSKLYGITNVQKGIPGC